MDRPQRLLDWKKRLDKKARKQRKPRVTYSRIAEKTPYSREAVRKTLKGIESAIPMDRDKVMDATERALAEIEAEDENKDEPAYAA